MQPAKPVPSRSEVERLGSTDPDTTTDPTLSEQQRLFRCAQNNDVNGIRKLKEANMQLNVNLADDGKQPDENGEGGVYGTGDTALHIAAANGNTEVCELLHRFEANVDVKNKLGSTPLIVAAAFGHTPVVRFLISKKADITATNKITNNALHCAVYAGHIETVSLLVEEFEKIGIDGAKAIGKRNGVGVNCWDYATQTSNSEMRTYLETIVTKYAQEKDSHHDTRQYMKNKHAPKDKTQGDDDSVTAGDEPTTF